MSIEERPDVDTDNDDCCFGDVSVRDRHDHGVPWAQDIVEVGFMFDNALPKTRRSFQFGDISVAVRLVDDDPGAVQSGHYVWPAAPALSAYLVDRQSGLPRASKCLELGAGCGLAGLVAAQLPSTTAVVFTDHDPGVLDLIRDSIAEQKQEPELGGSDAAAKCRCVQLSWGALGKDQRELLAEALGNVVGSSASALPPPEGEGSAERHSDGGGGVGGGDPFFDLVIASDVIYSVSVVEPLFQTVSGLLRPKPSSRSSSEALPVYVGCGNGTAIDPENSSRGDKMSGGETDRDGAGCSGDDASPGEHSEAVGAQKAMSQGVDEGGGGSKDGGGGADGLPVFVMSQSFGYDADTERAIEQACLELGLVRQVVWDELLLAPGASQHEHKEQQGHRHEPPQQQQQPQPPQQHRKRAGIVPAPEKRLHPTLNGSIHDGELLPLSKERRGGTKLQRFWRA